MQDHQQTMIAFDAGQSRFMLRAAALIWSHGHVLIHRDVGASNWSLPGGRIEFHETGAESLAREISEEIGSASEIGPLRFVIENFFEMDGRTIHSIGFYYEAVLANPPPFHPSDIVHRARDGAFELEFRWAPAKTSTLLDLNLKPTALCELIETMPDGLVHRINRVPA